MIKLRKYIITAIFSCLACCAFAQDPIFSQFYSASLFLNPALAADKQGLSATFNNRTNTNKNIATYNLNQLTIVYPFKINKLFNKPSTKHDHQSGAGLSLYREGTGSKYTLNTMGALMTLAHSVQLAKQHYLSAGLQAGFINKKQSDNFEWGSQYVEDMGYDKNQQSSMEELLKDKVNYPLFNAGLVYYFKNSAMQKHMQALNFDAFLGFSIYNINRPNISLIKDGISQIPTTTKLHGGLMYHINNLFSVKPNFIWAQQNQDNQVNFGSYFTATTQSFAMKSEDIYAMLGVWYRWGDSFILSLGAQYGALSAAVSYDFNTSDFEYKNRGKGATEVSLRYSMPAKKEKLHRGLLYPNYM